jgi:hypothetical protein
MSAVCRHTQLEPLATNGPREFEHIVASLHDSLDLPHDFREKVWHEAGAVAKCFGYSPRSHRPTSARDEQNTNTLSQRAAAQQLAAY